MARPTKIQSLGLEREALKAREQGLSADLAVERLNVVLKRRGSGDKVSEMGYRRWLATLDAATVPPAHQPQVAEQNARVAINVGEQIHGLNETLIVWLEEAKDARRFGVSKDGDRVDLGPDWQARTSVARELRQHTEFYVSVLEKIYDAEQVRMFQEEVMNAISEADPETASRIRDRMRARQSIRRAALLGA